MQLQLRPDPRDRRTMYLTDAAGRILPCQTGVVWSHGGPGEVAQAVVTFNIDGDKLAVVADPVETGYGTLPEALEAFGRLSSANKVRFLQAAEPPPTDRNFHRFKLAVRDYLARNYYI